MDSARAHSPELDESFAEKARVAYEDPGGTGALGGLRRLALAVGDDGKKTRRWARRSDAYTLHRPTRRKFRRRKTIVRGPGVQLQADLVDVGSHSRLNRGVKFLLTIVDAFSRRAWVEPLPSKRGVDVARALEKALEGERFEKLQTDKGKEFDNVSVAAWLKRRGAERFTTENDDIKASIVERFNKTLRQKLHTYMTLRPDDGYLEVLPDIVDAYNRTPHGATRLAPVAVNEKNAEEVYNRLFEEGGSGRRSGSRPVNRSPSLYAGDHVRISKTRRAFTRGYTPNWTREIFVVRRRLDWVRPTVYEIDDLAGERVAGTFYERELQRVEKPTEFRIERVLRTRGSGARRESFVKWEGYPDSFNSWVSASDFVRPSRRRR
jgi:hypothetical protein